MTQPDDNPPPATPHLPTTTASAADTPAETTTQTPGDTPAGTPGVFSRHMHFPNAYTWLLLLSAMDIMLTWTIFYFGGHEINPIADWVIKGWGLNGMIAYKFLLILFFIMICEIVGTLREPTGRALSRISLVIAAFPVAWSLLLLARFSGLLD